MSWFSWGSKEDDGGDPNFWNSRDGATEPAGGEWYVTPSDDSPMPDQSNH
jgi:hypothetical protein